GQPRLFPRGSRCCGTPEGAVDRRHRLCRLGPDGLARRLGRALVPHARPARTAVRGAAGRGLPIDAAVGPTVAGGKPRRAAARAHVAGPACADADQRHPARLAIADAGVVHGAPLWLEGGSNRPAADAGRQPDRGPGRAPGPRHPPGGRASPVGQDGPCVPGGGGPRM
ncbi:MAG: hypothetical protein AVDCRST_MAG31-316, partial [uncultured Sphingomonas sp.]